MGKKRKDAIKRNPKSVQNDEKLSIKKVSIKENNINNIKPKVFDIKKLKVQSAYKKPFSEGVLLELFENLNFRKEQKNNNALVIRHNNKKVEKNKISLESFNKTNNNNVNLVDKNENNLLFSTKSKERKEKFSNFKERKKVFVQKKLSDFFNFSTEKIKIVPVSNKTSIKEKVGNILSSSNKKEEKSKGFKPTTMRDYNKNKDD